MVAKQQHNKLQQGHMLHLNNATANLSTQQSLMDYVIQELRKILPPDCYPHSISALESTDLPFSQCPKKHRQYYDMDAINTISSRNIATLRLWHEEGRPLQASNERGETLLHIACRKCLLDVVEFLLLEACISLWVHDKKGRTPLHLVCNSLDPNALQLFHFIVKHEPDLLFVADEQGCTPLDYVPCEIWHDWFKLLETIDFHNIIPKRTVFNRNSIKDFQMKSGKSLSKAIQRNNWPENPEDENLVARDPKSTPRSCQDPEDRTSDLLHNDSFPRSCSQFLDDIASTKLHRRLQKSDNASKCKNNELNAQAQSPSISERTEKLSELWQKDSPVKFSNENGKDTSNRCSNLTQSKNEFRSNGLGPGGSAKLSPKVPPRVIKNGNEIRDMKYLNGEREKMLHNGGNSQKVVIQRSYETPEPSPGKVREKIDSIQNSKVHSSGYVVPEDNHIPFRSSSISTLKSPRKDVDKVFATVSKSSDGSDKETSRQHIRRSFLRTSVEERSKVLNTQDEMISEKINMLTNDRTLKESISSKSTSKIKDSGERNFVISRNQGKNEKGTCISNSSTDSSPNVQQTRTQLERILDSRMKKISYREDSQRDGFAEEKLVKKTADFSKLSPVRKAKSNIKLSLSNIIKDVELSDCIKNNRPQLTKFEEDGRSWKSTINNKAKSEKTILMKNNIRSFDSPKPSYVQRSRSNESEYLSSQQMEASKQSRTELTPKEPIYSQSSLRKTNRNKYSKDVITKEEHNSTKSIPMYRSRVDRISERFQNSGSQGRESSNEKIITSSIAARMQVFEKNNIKGKSLEVKHASLKSNSPYKHYSKKDGIDNQEKRSDLNEFESDIKTNSSPPNDNATNMIDLFPPEAFANNVYSVDQIANPTLDGEVKEAYEFCEQFLNNNLDTNSSSSSHEEKMDDFLDDYFLQNNEATTDDSSEQANKNAKSPREVEASLLGGDESKEEEMNDSSLDDCICNSLLDRLFIEDDILGQIRCENVAGQDGSQIYYLQLRFSAAVADLASQVAQQPPKRMGRGRRRRLRRMQSA